MVWYIVVVCVMVGCFVFGEFGLLVLLGIIFFWGVVSCFLVCLGIDFLGFLGVGFFGVLGIGFLGFLDGFGWIDNVNWGLGGKGWFSVGWLCLIFGGDV